jgi:hypothetical protein
MLFGNLLLEQNERYTYFLRICGKFFAPDFFTQRDYLFSYAPHFPFGHSAAARDTLFVK